MFGVVNEGGTMKRELLAAMVMLGTVVGAVAQESSPRESVDDRGVSARVTEPAMTVLNQLDEAWNASDEAAFAAQFTPDTDVININGTHFQGRAALAKQMRQIFDTVFKGSVHRSRTLELVRNLTDDTILAVSSAVIDVPSGPLAPEARSRQTLILVRVEGSWQIRHWHNTPIRAERIPATRETADQVATKRRASPSGTDVT
jgi:uncharacterized protein (TIGR02246 family)